MHSDHTVPIMLPPAYPSSADQAIPDLNLAGVSTPRTSLAGGNFSDSTPPQRLDVPALSTHDPNGDINQLGIDPKVSYFELNLAGNALPVASPAQLVAPAAQVSANEPTYSAPVAGVPELQVFDLAAPGIDAVAPFEPDPAAGNLLQFDRPRGLLIVAASETPLLADAMMPDAHLYDRPDGLDMPGPLMVDPALPSLQFPTREQQVEMPANERPADLAPAALAMMRDLPAYKELPTGNQKALWMAQQGNNQARERRLGLLMLGLEQEEG